MLYNNKCNIYNIFYINYIIIGLNYVALCNLVSSIAAFYNKHGRTLVYVRVYVRTHARTHTCTHSCMH